MREVMKADVEAKRMPGAVLLLMRHGKVALHEAVGFQDRAAQKPMKTDAIFRIASMTKPITSTAIMILAEEGKIDIGAPVATYLPEFRDVRVGIDKAAPKRPMTVQDLLRHTSGLTYGLFGATPVDELYRKANLFGAKSLEEMVKTLATLPLLHQPGEVWEYSVSTDVLGRIVEVVSGMELDRFIAERITGPLKMKDTAFYLTPEQAKRLAVADVPNPLLGDTDATKKPAILMGGGGLLSTAMDYGRFCQMMLNGGELDGVRILAPHTVALMASDQLPPGIERRTDVARILNAFGPTAEMGTGFGLGFAVRTDAGRNPVPGSVGDFHWGGITGTLFWIDPKDKLVAVMLAQLPQASNVAMWRKTRTLVYQAFVK
jgi:CubicO group peptidase (beta-lactamase class C family)